jgi:hypothetical protein
MTTEEFSSQFDTLLNSYNTLSSTANGADRQSIVLDEYEKSVFLTKAQQEIVISLYNGNNSNANHFEGTEELRRYLDELVITKVYTAEDEVTGTGVSPKSVFFVLPGNLAFITFEDVEYNDETLGCYNKKKAAVYPVTQDEYTRLRNNPFRGPTKYRVIRLDSGDNRVELISKYNIGSYTIRYIERLKPIVLAQLPDGLSLDGESDVTDCKLDELLHDSILKRAVELAISTRGHVNK